MAVMAPITEYNTFLSDLKSLILINVKLIPVANFTSYMQNLQSSLQIIKFFQERWKNMFKSFL